MFCQCFSFFLSSDVKEWFPTHSLNEWESKKLNNITLSYTYLFFFFRLYKKLQKTAEMLQPKSQKARQVGV